MPANIKEWYIRNNKTDMLTPINYNNEELSDIWDMEMVSEVAPVTTILDTVKKIDTFPKKKNPTPPTPSKKKNKESALNPIQKKKKISSK